MIKKFLAFFLIAFPLSCWGGIDNSLGLHVSGQYAIDGCDSNAVSCEKTAVGLSLFHRNIIYDRYYYRLDVNYLGSYRASYQDGSDPNLLARYKGEVFSLGLSGGRKTNILGKEVLLEVGVMPWLVSKTGNESYGKIEDHSQGVSLNFSMGSQLKLSNRYMLDFGYRVIPFVGGDGTGGAVINQFNIGLSFSSNSFRRTKSQTEYLINLGANNSALIFEFGSAQLNQSMHKILDSMLTRLQNYQESIVIIESHTDNIGSSEYNYKLSLRRSEAIKKYFIDNGVDDERIQINAHGENLPIVSNDTLENRAINRRVNLISPAFQRRVTK